MMSKSRLEEKIAFNAGAENVMRKILETFEVMDSRKTDAQHQLDYLYIDLCRGLSRLEQWKKDQNID